MARTKWLKRHSQDEIDRTRDHAMRERVVLNELSLLMDIYDGPVPYRVGAITARIQCDELPRQAVQASINVLFDAGDITVTPDGKGLIVPWVMDVISERAERCAANKRVAIDREAKRQHEASVSGASAEHGATSTAATSETINGNNDRTARNVPQTKTHHHQTQNPELEKDLDPSLSQPAETPAREPTVKDFSNSDFSIDDDDRPARPLPASLVRATEVAAGEERAAEIIAEYLSSDYGRRRLHDGAFVKWARKLYGITISTRGSTFGPRQMGELCGLDRFGKPDTTLPNKSMLARRSSAAVASTAN